MKMTNAQYDFWKKVALRWLPAVGTLYFALAQIWNFPYAEQIVGTITALVTFLGVILDISTEQYNRDLLVGEEPSDHSKEVG